MKKPRHGAGQGKFHQPENYRPKPTRPMYRTIVDESSLGIGRTIALAASHQAAAAFGKTLTVRYLVGEYLTCVRQIINRKSPRIT